MHNNSMNVAQRVVTLPAGVSTVIAPAVPAGRHYLAIADLGPSQDVFLAFDAVAVSNAGWPLSMGFAFTASDGVPTNQVRGVSATGTTVVVLEG